MADDDEIDILGDFSFNSCLAQNDQGIPSCSNREDTVHPQWLLDTTASNWYDTQNADRMQGPVRKLSGNSSKEKYRSEASTTWTTVERNSLVKEMSKYGRNIRKISQIIKTKTEAEIQAQIEANYGIRLDTPSFGLDKHEDQDDIPAVVQEEIVTDDSNILNMMSTGSPTVKVSRKPFRRKLESKRNSLLKPNLLHEKTDVVISSADIVNEDDYIVGSTESIGCDIMSSGVLVQKEQVKAAKKLGNHRRKVSRSYRSKEFKSTHRQRTDSSQSDSSAKSSKMQIVLGSGQALPLSEGEQVIKIEKKKDSDPESDIDVDIDSEADNEESISRKGTENVADSVMGGQRFEPIPNRQKKMKLLTAGQGGYTIMHTSDGDLLSVGREPTKQPRKPRAQTQLSLIPCRRYSANFPPPFTVHMNISALLLMDAHAHTSRGEVMGLAGGEGPGDVECVRVTAYRAARAAAAHTHCDMDPVSQAAAAEALSSQSARVVGWHHSHPAFPASPSTVDLVSQATLQQAGAPMLAFITSPHWPTGRTASQYRCFRIEESVPPSDDGTPVGYQFSVHLVPDLRQDNLQTFLRDLKDIRDMQPTELSVDMAKDICPDAGITYLEKCISSATHHLMSAGYDHDQMLEQLLHGIRDVFR